MSGWLTRNRGPGLRCECILDYGMPGVQAEEFGTDLIRLFVCCCFFPEKLYWVFSKASLTSFNTVGDV